jgi:hypothetical protein
MATTLPILLIAASLAASPRAETRCGWLYNPTPANWWLEDRHGQWIIGSQGGYQAPGMDNMPDMTTAGWVEENGSYGYGCACMRVTTDAASGRISRIFSATPRPLRQCRNDRRLRRPE